MTREAHTDEALIAEAQAAVARYNEASRLAVGIVHTNYWRDLANLISALASRLATITPEREEEDGSSRASTSSPPNGDPGGKWVLVPREPTPHMINAFVEVAFVAKLFGSGWDAFAAESFQAMIAAAPEPPPSDRPLEGRDVVSLPSGTHTNPSPPPPQSEG